MRQSLMGLVVIVLTTISISPVASPQRNGNSTPELELKLAPESASLRQGEQLKLRIEIRNIGSEDIIIAQNIDARFGNSTLHLRLEGNSIREDESGMAADGIPEANPDFEKTFVTNWLTLNRGHFYGTYIYIDPIEFPHLRQTGHYRVTAEYWSRGISSTPGWNGGYLKQQDVDNLPVRAFEGTLVSNVVSVQVLPKNRTRK